MAYIGKYLGNLPDNPDNAGINTLKDVDTRTYTPSDRQALVWDATAGVWKPSSHALADVIANSSSTAPADPVEGQLWFDTGTTGQLYVYSGSAWISTAGITSLEYSNLADLADVSSSSPTDGQFLSWDAANSQWIPTTGGASGISLTDISVGAEASASGDGGISYNNSNGVFTYTPPDLSTYLTDITNESIGDLSDVDFTSTAPTDGQALVWDNTNSKWIPGTTFSGSYDDLTDKPTIPADVSDLTDTTNLLDHFSGSYNDLTDAPTIPSALTDLGIVDGTSGQVLTTDGNGGFTFTTVSGGSYTLADLTDVDVISTDNTPADGDVLTWDNTNSKWIPSTPFSGSYTDLSDKPTIPADVSDLTDTTNLLDHFSGSYNDLTDKPTIPSALSDLSDVDTTSTDNVPANGDVLTWDNVNSKWIPGTTFSGDYNDLTNAPTLFSGDYNDLTNTPTLFSGDYNDLTNAPTLFSGSYTDLTDKPTIPADVSDLTDTTNLLDHFSGSYNDLTDKPVLATVATSGSYNDLTDKPTIPAALSDLSDIDTTSTDNVPADGDVLTWDNTNSKWIPGTLTGGTGVTITSGEISIGQSVETTDSVTFASVKYTPTATAPTYSEGTLWYDSNSKTLSIQSDTSEFPITIGEREWVRCRNNTGSTITKGSPVYVTGVHISGDPVHGHHPTIALADASDSNKYNVIGLVGHDIADGSHGYVVVRGWIQGIDTSTLTEGTRVHLGYASPGTIIDTAPSYPNFPTDIGICLTSDATDGAIYVDIAQHSFEGLRVSGSGRFGGNLTIEGDLTILGTQTVTNSNSIAIGAPFNYLNSGDTIGEANTVFTGSGLNDAYFAGQFEGTSSETYYVAIDGVGTGTDGVDTFKWSYNSDMSSPQATGVDLVADTDIVLDANDNISIHFQAATGHTLADKWSGTASPVNVDTGWSSNRNTGTSGVGYTHIGMFFDVTDEKFKLFDTYSPEPEGSIDVSDASYNTGTLVANIEGTVTGTVSSLSNHDTDDLSEGSTNLYYTDTRVGSYLTTNSYATQSYVTSAISGKADTSSLATVATSGSYNDLTDKPTLFSGSYTDLTDKPTLFSGSYNDLTDKPTIPAALSELTDVDVTSTDNVPANGDVLTWDSVNSKWIPGVPTGGASVTVSGTAPSSPNDGDLWFDNGTYGRLFLWEATSSAWIVTTPTPQQIVGLSDLTDVDLTSTGNVPLDGDVLTWDNVNSKWIPGTPFSGSYNDLTNTPTLFSGSYTDLTNTPTIPSALTDLGILDGTSGQVLTTDGSGNFSFTTVSGGGGASALSDLTDVDTTSTDNVPANGDVLTWDNVNSKWIPGTPFSGDYNDLTNTPTIPSLTGYATETYVDTAIADTIISATNPAGGGIVFDAGAALSGSTVDFVDIPSWAKRITLIFDGVSTDGSSDFLIQTGSSGTYTTSGYVGVAFNIRDNVNPGATAMTTGFLVRTATNASAADTRHGRMTLSRMGSTNTWKCDYSFGYSNNATASLGSGSVNQANLDSIRLISGVGDTFDAGSIYISYEGGGGGSTVLSELLDVDTTSTDNVPANGDVLTWDSVNSTWIPNTPFSGSYNDLADTPTIPADLTDLGIVDGTSGQVLTTDGNGGFTFTTVSGGGGGASALSDLTDVDTTSTDNVPANGDVLTWDSVNSTWIPSVPPSGNGASLTVSETAPLTASEGDLWYDPSTLETYIYYLDGNGNYFWVSADSTAAYTDSPNASVGNLTKTYYWSGDLELSTGTLRYYFNSSSTIVGVNAFLVSAGSGTSTATIVKNGQTTINTINMASGETANIQSGLDISMTSQDYLTINITAVSSGAADLYINIIYQG